MLDLSFHLCLATLLATTAALATLYIICLILGGGLLVISTVLGGDTHSGADVGLDVHGDVGAGFGPDLHTDTALDGAPDAAPAGAHDADLSHDHAGHGGLALMRWFSITFLVYFLAVFGLVGTVLTYLSDFGAPLVLIAALIAGAVVGQSVHQLLRLLRRSSGDSTVSTSEYLYQTGTVSAAIAPPGVGEVSVKVRGSTRFVPAVARHPHDRFNRGDAAVIVAVRDGTAELITPKEHAFLNETQPGGTRP